MFGDILMLKINLLFICSSNLTGHPVFLLAISGNSILISYNNNINGNNGKP